MTTLGRYEIFDQLGTGSAGTVYRARDVILDREVALKTIRTGGDVQPEVRERFYREARACARLQHPSIVVVHDFGEADQVAYIAMELLTGADFRKLIDQRTEIPLSGKLDAMAQVCEALAYAHRLSIIHRDIKPSNLFLIDKKYAKVLDFGIARLPSSQLTAQGQILGTPNYMAPEQIQGKSPDGRADLFSAAVVFFEFLAYAHPFQSDAIPRRIVEGQPDPLSAYQAFPLLLDRVFARALARDPARRYQSGDDFAADLRAITDAVSQNASPTFSSVQLPSERGIGSPLSSTGASTPPEPDDFERQLQELMRLVPEFEEALAQDNTTLARQVLSQLEALGTSQSRYAEAVRLCRARLQEFESAARPLSPTDPTQTLGGQQVCPDCGETNRAAATYCIKCGARLIQSARPAPVPPAPPPPDPPRAVKPPAPEPVAAPPPPVKLDVKPAAKPAAPSPPKQPARPLAGAGINRRYVWVGLAVLAAIILIVIIARPSGSAPLAKKAGTAVVSSTRAFIYQAADQSARTSPVSKGDVVNILELPAAPDQSWVRVQLVRGNKAQRPGFMHTFDLTGWKGTDADSSLALLRTFQLGPVSTDGQIKNQIDVLQQFVAGYPGTRPAGEAQGLMAGLELVLAQHLKTAGRPDAEWQALVESGKTHLASSGQSAASYQSQIDDLTGKTAPELPKPDKAQQAQEYMDGLKRRIAKYLARADELWAQKDDHPENVDETEKLVNQVLKLDKTDEHARALKQKIERRKEILGQNP